MSSSGFYRLQQAIKARAKRFFTPKEATEKEADMMLGPNRDAKKMMEENMRKEKLARMRRMK